MDTEVPLVDVETLMSMPEYEKHLLVQRRFDAIKQNRRLREDGVDKDGFTLKQYTSNFRQVMRTLELREAKDKKKSRNGSINGPLPGVVRSENLNGPLMTEIRRLEAEEAAKKRQKLKAAIQKAQRHQLNDGGGEGGEDSTGRGEGDSYSGGAAHNVLDFIDEDDIEKAALLPIDLRERNKALVATALKKEEMQAVEQRNENIKSFSRLIEAQMALIRPRLKRSKSSPGAFKSIAMFEQQAVQLIDQRNTIEDLEKQLKGAAPRSREKQLEKQISSLEDQISNQVALIRGLREKLRIMREQHQHCLLNQRQITNAIANAYVAGEMSANPLSPSHGSLTPATPHPLMPLRQVHHQSMIAEGSGDLIKSHSGSGAESMLNTTASPRPNPEPLSGSKRRASNMHVKNTLDSHPPTTPLEASIRDTKKGARVLHQGKNQLLDERGIALPQGKGSAAAVITVHSLAHLQMVLPELVADELATLRAVLVPPNANQQNVIGASRGGLRASEANNNGKKQRARVAQAGSLGSAPPRLHPFTLCNAVEAGRFSNDSAERFLFIFPSATDAVKYALLIQHCLLEANWNPSLGDEHECSVEHMQGLSSEYVWRGLRVSIGIELAPTIRPELLLADISVPPPLPFRPLHAAADARTPSTSALLQMPPASPLMVPSDQIQATNPNAVASAAFEDLSENEAESIAIAERVFLSNCPTLAIPYEGHATDTASYLSCIGVGGEILMTKAVVDLVDVEAVTEVLAGHFQYKYLISLGATGCPISDFTPILRYWGDLGYHFSKSSIFRIVSPTLAAREAHFRRDLVNAERAFATQQATSFRGPFDEVPPPSATLAGRPIAMLGVSLSDWDIAKKNCPPAATTAAKSMVFAAIRDLSVTCRGYVSRIYNSCEAFVICFDEVLNAVNFGLKIHDHLMSLEWPESILRIPQFSRVEIEKNLLFNGPRVQCGLAVCTPGKRTTGTSVLFTYRDALTQRLLYCGGGSELVSLYTQQAVGGELLVPVEAISIITKHHEFLGFAIQSHCVDVSTQTSDTLIALYQVFTRKRRLAASYVNRETRLRSEDDAATDNKIVKMYEEQIAVLKEKLYNKDQSIKRLDNIIGEKNNVIAEIRSEVMKHAHYRYSLQDTLDRMAISSSRQTIESVLVGVSFSGAEELFTRMPTEAAAAAKIFGKLVDTVAQECHARIVNRLPSGVARIYQFGEPSRAVDFWFKIFDRSINLDWPQKLDETQIAGLVRAADIVENLHPNLDQVVWRGLRPIAAMDYGLPSSQFEGISKTYVPYGPEIDFIGDMLAAAAEGDCIVSTNCSSILHKSLSKQHPTARLTPYGEESCDRLVNNDAAGRMRLKALRTVFPPNRNVVGHKARNIHKCLAVFVTIADVNGLEDKFTSDVVTFQKCVEGMIGEYEGTMIGCDGKGCRYSLLFEDIDNGIDFMSTIHSILMHCPWSSALLREPEFADRIHEDKQIMGGIAARVGAHILHDVTVLVQKFGGYSLFKHTELAIPVVLSHHAHAGETLATEEVFTELMQSTKERSAKIYPDLIAALAVEEVRAHPIHVYQILPMELHFRSALFLEEDRINADPVERERRKAQSKKSTQRRKQYFDAIVKDDAMLQTCERTLNPIDDPVRLNQRLYQHVKASVDEDRRRAKTSLSTLQMLEAISMMTEDRAALPPSSRGYPFHVHLVLYLMENTAMCRDPSFSKKYAVELLSADWGASDDPEATTINSILSHVEGTAGGRGRNIATCKSTDGEADPHTPTETFAARMQRMKDQKVLPEDLVQLHVDIERFSNILELHGVSIETARQWVSCFPDLCMGDVEGGVSALAKQLRLLSSMKATIGLSIDDIDADTIRRSIVANLSHLILQMVFEGDGLGT